MGDGYGIGGKWGGKKREKRWIQESVRIRSRGEGRRKVKREGREREKKGSAPGPPMFLMEMTREKGKGNFGTLCLFVMVEGRYESEARILKSQAPG